MISHAWRERTEDGDLRFMRAHKHGGVWRLQSRLKSEEHWTDHDPIGLDDFKGLRDVLWRKYRRRRVPFADIEQIDALIEGLSTETPSENA